MIHHFHCVHFVSEAPALGGREEISPNLPRIELAFDS